MRTLPGAFLRRAASVVGVGCLAVVAPADVYAGGPAGLEVELPWPGAEGPGGHNLFDEPIFLGLGGLPDGIPGSKAFDITPDGGTVVGVANSEDGPVAFRWTIGSGMEALGDLPGGFYDSTATAVSTGGNTVVGFSESFWGEEAFRWTQGSGMQGLGDFSTGPFVSKATDVSSDGSVIVGWGAPGKVQLEAFIWSARLGMIGLGDLPGGLHASRAMAISGDGTRICGWGNSGNIGVNEAFLWTENDGMVGLGFLPNRFLDGSMALGMSLDGEVIVGAGWAELGYQAFRWTAEEGMVALGDLPGGNSQPYSIGFGVSGDGTTVVGTSDTDLGLEAFVWDAQRGMRNLREVLTNDYGFDLTGWTLVEGRAASLLGTTIVGWGEHDGEEEAFLAHIPTDCPADLNGDGLVGLRDLLILLANVGACVNCDECLGDVNGDCVTDVADLATLIGAWGPCP